MAVAGPGPDGIRRIHELELGIYQAQGARGATVAVPEVRMLLGDVLTRLCPPWTGTPDQMPPLEGLLRRLPVTFDRIISTEGGKFKPHPSVYARALSTLGVARDELLHVAGSATDAAGATAFGIRTVWVNRAGHLVADPRFAPAYDVKDLNAVLEIASSLRSSQ